MGEWNLSGMLVIVSYLGFGYENRIDKLFVLQFVSQYVEFVHCVILITRNYRRIKECTCVLPLTTFCVMNCVLSPILPEVESLGDILAVGT